MKKILMSLFLVHSILKSCEYNQNFNQEFQEQEQNYYPQEYQQQIYVQPQYFLQSKYSQQQVQQYPMQAQQQSYQQYPVYIQPQYDQYEPQYYSEQLQYPIVTQPQFYQEQQVDMQYQELQYQEQLRQQQHQEQFYLQQQNFTPELLVNPVAMQLQDSSKSFKLNPQAQPFYSNLVLVEKKLEPLNNVDVVSQESQFVNQPTDNDFTQNENERPLEVVSHDKTLLLKNLIFSKPVLVVQPIKDVVTEIDNEQQIQASDVEPITADKDDQIQVFHVEPIALSEEVIAEIDVDRAVQAVCSQLVAANLHDNNESNKTKKRRPANKKNKKTVNLEFLDSAIKENETADNDVTTFTEALDAAMNYKIVKKETELQPLDIFKEVEAVFIETNGTPYDSDFEPLMRKSLGLILGESKNISIFANCTIHIIYGLNRDYINSERFNRFDDSSFSLDFLLNSISNDQDMIKTLERVFNAFCNLQNLNLSSVSQVQINEIKTLFVKFGVSFMANFNRIKRYSDAEKSELIFNEVRKYIIKSNIYKKNIVAKELEAIIIPYIADFYPRAKMIAEKIVKDGSDPHIFMQYLNLDSISFGDLGMSEQEMNSTSIIFKAFIKAFYNVNKSIILK